MIEKSDGKSTVAERFRVFVTDYLIMPTEGLTVHISLFINLLLMF